MRFVNYFMTVAVTQREDHRAAPDIAKRDQMCYVSNLDIWRDLEGDRVANRHKRVC